MPCALRISEAASLALHAMGLLAIEPERSLSAKAIASSFQVSEAHLAKVLQRLVRVGLLRSSRGPRGGFSLTRQPSDVTLLEVFEAIEGPMNPSDCLFSAPLCEGSDCMLGSVLVEVNQLLVQRFSGTTLADVSSGFESGPANLVLP